jgi:hypothetical protein
MPRKLRIGHARAFRVSGDVGSYAMTGKDATLTTQFAELTGPDTVGVNTLTAFYVTLANEATAPYTVTWYQAGVEVGTSVIGVGTFDTSIDLSWSTAGAKTVDFVISPVITRTGNPLSVTVSAAEVVTTATLNGPESALEDQSAQFSVVLDVPADQAYSVSWTAASGLPSSGTVGIAAGELTAAFSTTWTAAHAGRSVAFNLVPTTNTLGATITKIGSPVVVPVDAATSTTPTLATLSGLTSAELDRWNVYLVTLNQPADRTYTVDFRQTGPARLYWSRFKIPPGQTFAWTMAKWEGDPAHPSGPTGSIDFVISPSVTKSGGPISVAVTGAGDAPPSVAFLTGNGMVQANFARTYTARLNTIADRDYTVTFSASTGSTISETSVVIPTGYSSCTTSIEWSSATTSASVSISISPSTNLSGGALTLIKSPLAVRVLPAFTPVYNQRVLNTSRVLQFLAFNGTGRYVRFVRNMWLPQGTTKLNFNVAAYGGTNPAFQATSYQCVVYPEGDTTAGVVVATEAVTAGAGTDRFESVNLSAIPSGWHLFDIRPTPPQTTDETCAMFWMYVGEASAWHFKEWAPVQSGSWTLNHEDPGSFWWGKVPAFIDPPTIPVPESTRIFPSFSTPVSKSDLYRRNLVSPCVNGDPNFVRVLSAEEGSQYNTSALTTGALEGVRSSFQPHGYGFNVLANETPQLVMRDGPFGVGLIASLTHCEIGTAAPVDGDGNTIVIENRYFTDAWSMGKIRKTGEIKRMAGYRHDELAGRILLGDWSRIEMAGKKLGFHETWGLAWDERSFTSQETHPPIPGERNLRPHESGIQAFVTDSQNHRVLSLKFDRYEHDSPPIVSVFMESQNDEGQYAPAGWAGADFQAGLGGDPWDCVAKAGILYISERMRNRVSMWDIDTRTYIGNIIAGPEYTPTGFYAGYGNIGYVQDGRHPTNDNDDHWIRRTFTKVSGYSSHWSNWQVVPTYVQQPDIIMPEGLYIMDNWLYVGSAVTGLVRRVDLTDNTLIETPFKFQPTSDIANSLYCKVTVSDGTFGPRHTVFAMTWEKDAHSLPFTRIPQTEAQKASGEPGDVWALSDAANVEMGRGPQWNSLGYTCGVGQYGGRLLVATADYGMFEISHYTAGDVALNDTLYAQGRDAFEANAGRLKYGIAGYRPWKGTALPWGESTAKDYYLTSNYHTEGEA